MSVGTPHFSWLPSLARDPVLFSGTACLVSVLLFSLILWINQKHIPVEGILQILKQRLHTWSYLINGPSIIRQGFDQSNVLSLNGAAKHMLQPHYTMNGFNWFDRRGVEGVGFVRTLRTLLTNNIPQLIPDLGVLVRTRWAELLSNKTTIGGESLIVLITKKEKKKRKKEEEEEMKACLLIRQFLEKIPYMLRCTQ
ncbi:hypothetical protein F4779DRAFT_326777 [Xylariaceae sp. FL0662B]|nr:hypothetical protein F4779DRAFT_326777 [Xylariaceae sp. FL0662B]